jgi:hypothetical protein
VEDAMRRLWPLLFVGCGVFPTQSVKEECLSVFVAFDEAMRGRCAVHSSPSRSMCDDAVDVDSKKLAEDCLPWLSAAACDDISTESMAAHCGVVTVKLW